LNIVFQENNFIFLHDNTPKNNRKKKEKKEKLNQNVLKLSSFACKTNFLMATN